MRVLSVGLSLLVLLTTSKTFSQPKWQLPENLLLNTSLELPEWENRQEFACYDLSGAKVLKEYEAECTGAKEKLQIVYPLLRKYVDSLNAYDESVMELTARLQRVSEALKAQVRVSDRSESLRQEAEYWSITGNMLPWVITGFVVAFSSGYVIASSD